MSKRLIQRHPDSGNIWTYYTSSKKNPCGCGSNCYHYEFDGTRVVGVCNACQQDVYEVKPEYTQEYLDKGSWLPGKDPEDLDRPIYLPGPEKALKALRSRIVQVHLNAEPDTVEIVLPLTMDVKDTESVDLYLESFIEHPIDYWEVLA